MTLCNYSTAGHPANEESLVVVGESDPWVAHRVYLGAGGVEGPVVAPVHAGAQNGRPVNVAARDLECGGLYRRGRERGDGEEKRTEH
jgi:hypothetical protein